MANQKRRINVYSYSPEDFSRGGLKSDRTPEDLTAALAQANGFDLSYLTDNSQGELSPGQLGLLVSPLLGSMLIFLLPGVFFYASSFFNRDFSRSSFPGILPG